MAESRDRLRALGGPLTGGRELWWAPGAAKEWVPLIPPLSRRAVTHCRYARRLCRRSSRRFARRAVTLCWLRLRRVPCVCWTVLRPVRVCGPLRSSSPWGDSSKLWAGCGVLLSCLWGRGEGAFKKEASGCEKSLPTGISELILSSRDCETGTGTNAILSTSNCVDMQL